MEKGASERIDRLEKLVGQPPENAKPLFEIVAALNRELLELKLKIEGNEIQNRKN